MHGGPGLAEVVLVETIGSETQVLARFGRERITAVFHERFAEAPETTVALTPDAAAVHPFDAETGCCLG
jgi:multiple sugar transport system ATP-binding protein